uniref:hypothetical protein n=1 Tax=Altererythrobacter segetis TaxID=1104773 RepID=UPI0014095059|nr:hypothetical protein [Altererythrobacter segetis]
MLEIAFAVCIAIPLVIPVAQLVPLPPSIWTTMRARRDAVDASSPPGNERGWPPFSLSWSRTLASLLTIIPVICCAYAVLASISAVAPCHHGDRGDDAGQRVVR